MRRSILIKEACFQQACEETRLLLADKSIHSSEYAFISGFHESMDRRIRSLTERPGEAINFPKSGDRRDVIRCCGRGLTTETAEVRGDRLQGTGKEATFGVHLARC